MSRTPATLPLEVRQAMWARLWRDLLLAPPAPAALPSDQDAKNRPAAGVKPTAGITTPSTPTVTS